MPRILVTGSADGLGRATADTLLRGGHEVVVHARSRQRLEAVGDLLDRGAVPVVGDLADEGQTRDVAGQVNRIGRMDAVIHNAGVYTGRTILPVNVVAPYLLTALVDRPRRLVYLSSGMHRGGRPDLAGLDWSGRSARLFAVAGNARSRVNTATVTANFVAGAIGSALAGLLWSAGGWTAVTGAGVVCCVSGLGVWAAARRGPLVVPGPQ